jgi:hypothetical protein
MNGLHRRRQSFLAQRREIIVEGEFCEYFSMGEGVNGGVVTFTNHLLALRKFFKQHTFKL